MLIRDPDSSLARRVSRVISLGGLRRVSILIYHRVLPDKDPLRPGDVDAETFDWHMATLAKFCTVVPLADAITSLLQGGPPTWVVSVTFDDGYKDNVDSALPILERYDIPAAFFVASAYLDGGRMWNDTIIDAVGLCNGVNLDLRGENLGFHNLTTTQAKLSTIRSIIAALKYQPAEERERLCQAVVAAAGGPTLPSPMMSTSDLNVLTSSNMTIGGHTLSHPILSRLSPEVAWDEIAGNKKDLEAVVGRPLELFAYPNGKPGTDFGAEHVRMVREIGYAGAVTTARGAASPGSDPYQMPRFTPWDKTPLRFLSRLAVTALRYPPVTVEANKARNEVKARLDGA